ncbi:hypothetical protein UPYG_G00093840 [Umbra pygmaea]|uniref:Gelsolin-like domain-containing protein n=1 Tax=Umbra pygmaea TaxID=75934 RepID=A0ABD0X3V1_UMBPY
MPKIDLLISEAYWDFLPSTLSFPLDSDCWEVTEEHFSIKSDLIEVVFAGDLLLRPDFGQTGRGTGRMETMENPVPESRSERIARYKAERRRELQERFGNMEELTPKWVRKDGAPDPDSAPLPTDQNPSTGVNGRAPDPGRADLRWGSSPNLPAEPRQFPNGSEAGVTAEPAHRRRLCSSDSAGMLSGGQPVAPLGPSGPDQLHTRVSVGRLRTALLHQTDTQPEKESFDCGYAASGLDLAVNPGPEGGRRRTRRYLPGVLGSGCGDRKTNERFRTQPITACEMQETCGLPEELEADSSKADVKTDDRAKMSVAAKMSLFKELERTAAPEVSSYLKPRSGSLTYDHRVRRGNELRSLTQPITCEEMVVATSPQTVMSGEAQAVQSEVVVEDDENCKLSMSEKLALFTKLSLPGKAGDGLTDAPPERRRQKGARYRTQPITVNELQTGPVQLPPFRLSPTLVTRQQETSANLRPSEVRQAQPQTSWGVDLEHSQVPDPTRQGVQHPELRGILRKSHSGGPDRGGERRNGLGESSGEGLDHVPGARRERPASSAPWRQRNRNRRETVAVCAPARLSSEQGQHQEGRPSLAKLREKIGPSVEDSSSGRDRLLDTSQEIEDEDMMRGGCPARKTVLEDPIRKEDSEIPHDAPVPPQCWEPVFSSVYSNSTTQYVMCYNQTRSSFEAQEVSPPTETSQPQWRKKQTGTVDVEEQELQTSEEEGTRTIQEEQELQKTRGGGATSDSSPYAVSGCMVNRDISTNCGSEVEEIRNKLDEMDSVVVTHSTAQDVTPVVTSEGETEVVTPVNQEGMPCGFHTEVPPPIASALVTDGDLNALCQTNSPMLTSEVAQHRRSVRPSRRTQGSRNPLRALAARHDIQQDLMGDNVTMATVENNRTHVENRVRANTDGGRKVNLCEDVTSRDALTSNNNVPLSYPLLIHIKGWHQVQVRVVEPTARSLNSGDCFLLVTQSCCFLWTGQSASGREKAKASALASSIQGQADLGCQAVEVTYLEEGVNTDNSLASDFWNLLGGKTEYRGVGPPEEDELYEMGVVESNCVYRLVDHRLVPHEQAWATAPSVSLLDPTEALVFDFGSEVYLWLGQDVAPGDRGVAVLLAQQVWGGPYDYRNCRVNPLDSMHCNPEIQPQGEGRPVWALFGLLSENHETSLFREKFLDWVGPKEQSAVVGEEQEVAQSVAMTVLPQQPWLQSDSVSLCPCDAKALVAGQRLAVPGDAAVPTVLEGVDVQRGHGVVLLGDGHQAELNTVAVDTWHIEENGSEVQLGTQGQLHEGDTYLIRWTYNLSSVDQTGESQTERSALFLWQGRHSQISGGGASGLRSHEEAQVIVPQGMEPPCFLQLFQGGLVIHKGCRADSASNTGRWRLFCVRGELPEEASLLEVDCSCGSLRSRGAIVLLSSQQGALYLWNGCKVQASAREAGKRAVERLTQMCPPELGLSRESPVKVKEVEEGAEPAEFWNAIGPQDRKSYDCMLQDPGKYNFTPRLFHLSAHSGTFQGEELQNPTRLPGVVSAMPFVQENLYSVPQPALFLLDNRMEVYLWKSGEPEDSGTSGSVRIHWANETRCAMQTVIQYCKERNPRRPSQAYLIQDGDEPFTFTNVFPRWEKRTSSQGKVDRQVKLTLVQDALVQLTETLHTQEELLQTPLPQGVDPQHLEIYLSDRDVQCVLDMKR